MTTVLERQLEEAKENVKKLQKKLDAQKSNRKISCANCNEKHKIKDIDLIDVQYYVEPYSCAGGGYWNHSEYNFICPSCKIRNRFLTHLDYKLQYDYRMTCSPLRMFFWENVGLFKSVDDVKDKNQYGQFVNNFFLDKDPRKWIGDEKFIKYCSKLSNW